MIKPDEKLSKGNYLSINNEIVIVKGLPCDNFIQYSKLGKSAIYGEPIESFDPIPLTEQWLKDFGFKQIDNKHKDGSVSMGIFSNYPGIIEKNKLNEGENPFRFCRSIPSEINEFNFVCFVKYTHHLQNIYRDLFELELTKQ